MKNIVLIAALCVEASLDGMHATRRVCKEIPNIVPAALKEIAEAFGHERKARDFAVEVKNLIQSSTSFDEQVVANSKKLRVNLLPDLIVAAAQTRSVLSKYSGVVSVWDAHYEKKEVVEDYISEFASYAFGGTLSNRNFYHDPEYKAA